MESLRLRWREGRGVEELEVFGSVNGSSIGEISAEPDSGSSAKSSLKTFEFEFDARNEGIRGKDVRPSMIARWLCAGSLGPV